MGGGHTQIALKESLTSRIPGGTRSTNRDDPPVPRQPSTGLGGFLSRGPWPAHEHRLTQGYFRTLPTQSHRRRKLNLVSSWDPKWGSFWLFSRARSTFGRWCLVSRHAPRPTVGIPALGSLAGCSEPVALGGLRWALRAWMGYRSPTEHLKSVNKLVHDSSVSQPRGPTPCLLVRRVVGSLDLVESLVNPSIPLPSWASRVDPPGVSGSMAPSISTCYCPAR